MIKASSPGNKATIFPISVCNSVSSSDLSMFSISIALCNRKRFLAAFKTVITSDNWHGIPFFFLKLPKFENMHERFDSVNLDHSVHKVHSLNSEQVSN